MYTSIPDLIAELERLLSLRLIIRLLLLGAPNAHISVQRRGDDGAPVAVQSSDPIRVATQHLLLRPALGPQSHCAVVATTHHLGTVSGKHSQFPHTERTFPSGKNPTPETSSVWPRKHCTHCPESKSQSLTSLSPDPLASMEPVDSKQLTEPR